MAKFLVLIYEDEQRWEDADDALRARNHAQHGEFMARTGEARLGGQALQHSSSAVTLRRDGDDRITVTDGPFAETKEALGGFYLLEAPDRDAAVDLAKGLPSFFGGAIEVRPVQEMG